jgi:hypothetical protein
MAVARFWVRTAVLVEEGRLLTGGRTAAREALSGVLPLPLPGLAVTGMGESRRMEAGEDGRAPPLPEAVRFMDSLDGFVVVVSGKAPVTGDGAPLPLPVLRVGALRKRPISWLVWRSARVWAIIRRKSTPTLKDVALFEKRE